HQPGHQVGAVTAEIEERARAVELRIVEPASELWWHVDLRGSLMTIVNDDFANFADGLLVHEIVSSMVAAVPGCLVVDQDDYFAGARGSLDGAAIFHAHGEGLLHHHRHPVLRAGLHRAAMVEGIGVDED